MKKRTFIKLCTATVAMPFELSSLASPEKLSNWAGNIEYSTENVATANSVASVQDFVGKHSSFKTLGTRHCFNRIADSSQQLLTADFAVQTPAIDSAARTISLGPGIRYGTIAPMLEKSGFALHNLASLPHISVAGAITAGTHGSGVKNGNLSTVVVALEIVNAAGDIVALSRKANPDIFPGAVVGLGALGVISKVTLNIQPTFQVAQYVFENLSFDSLKDHFDQVLSAAYSVSLFTDWQNQRVNEVWLKHRIDPAKPPVKQRKDFFGATRATRNLHPIAALSAENCTDQMGTPAPSYDRLPQFNPRPHWGNLFTIPPAQLQSRYEKLPEFIALAKKFDPQGKFRNEFLNTNIFGAVS